MDIFFFTNTKHTRLAIKPLRMVGHGLHVRWSDIAVLVIFTREEINSLMFLISMSCGKRGKDIRI